MAEPQTTTEPTLEPQDMTDDELKAAISFHEAEAHRFKCEAAKIWRLRIRMDGGIAVDKQMLADLHARRASRVSVPSIAPDGISWTALLSVLERLRSKNRNPNNEWYHGWNSAIQCLINDINARNPAPATTVAPQEQSERDKATPLCAVHQRLEDAGKLECEVGNDCVACSLNERRELLALIAPFAAEGNTEDSVTVQRRVADFYQTHAGEGRVVVSYPAPAAPALHCSCGAACTPEEYEAHRAMGHDDPAAPMESPILAFESWLVRWVADNGRKLTQDEYGIAYAAFIAAHPGEGPKAHVMAASPAGLRDEAEISIGQAAKAVYRKYGVNLAAFWRDAFAAEAHTHGRAEVEQHGVDGNCIHCIPICHRCRLTTIEAHLKEKDEIRSAATPATAANKIADQLIPHLDHAFLLTKGWRDQIASIIERSLSSGS